MGNSAGPPFVPLPELVAAVADGSRVGVGGALLTRLPLAALHALAARRPRDLTYVSWGGGIPLEILLGAGAVRRIVFCFSSLDIFGLAPLFRRAVEEDRVSIDEWPAFAFTARLEAAKQNLPAMPFTWPAGTDLLDGQPAVRRETTGDADTGYAARLDLDVFLIHAQRADEHAEKVSAEITAAGGRAIAISGSVADAGDAERAVQAAIRSFGGLDLLVNNAGVVIYGEVPGYREQDWDTVVDTNLKGQFLMAKYAIPRIRERGGGAIVNLASVQAIASQREVASYAASKGGVVSLTKSLALDHALDRIRVNCVLPGSVRTPMLQRAAELAEGDPEQTIAAWGRIHPRGTVIEPEEIAAVVLFLLSSDSSAMTGAAVVADAGLTAQAAF